MNTFIQKLVHREINRKSGAIYGSIKVYNNLEKCRFPEKLVILNGNFED